jgi:GH25 family lysozyme M1 (1,4-beta-N-acetylmuramidase)
MTLFGWDASHYDGVPDGARVVSEGFSFMTHKAGGDKNDPELASWWNAVKGQRGKLLLGAYWVLYPGSPTARADAFLDRLDSQCPGWRDGPFILQLDCEIWNGDMTTRPGKADVKAACDRLKAKAPKLTPIVYASAGQYDNSLAGLGYPLWNARYPVSGTGAASVIYERAGGDSGKGWTAYGGQTPAIWQFTSSATIAGQTTCDANAFRGTLAQLTALLAPGWEKQDMELTDKVGSDAYPARTVEDFFNDFWGMRDPLVVGSSKTPALPAGSPLAKLIAMPAQLAALQAQVASLAGNDVDEDAIIAGVLAGLDPAKIAAAIPADVAEQVADILAKRLSA